MDLNILLQNEQPERPLASAFYVDPRIFEVETRAILERQWLLAGHVAMIPNPGDYFLFDVASESLIVCRQRDGSVAAFFNVCRHRGSRICREPSGHANAFTCPYHAWSYHLDGALRAAPHMPADFDPGDERLEQAHVEVLEGLIFLSIGQSPLSFDPVREVMTPFLRQSGTGAAQLAVRRSYPTDANWKLVVENFQECYHCAPSHRLYCSVHSRAKLLAFGAGPGSGPAEAVAQFAQEFSDFQQAAEALGTWLPVQEEAAPQEQLWVAGRFPIGRGCQSETADGRPAAPLIGDFKTYDGGQTTLAFSPFGYFMGSNDHYVLIRFTPREVLKTDVEFLWFVAPGAQVDRDFTIERLTGVWDVTTREDKTITEDNQAGVSSRRYQPGRYSQLESRLATIKDWYLRALAHHRHDRLEAVS